MQQAEQVLRTSAILLLSARCFTMFYQTKKLQDSEGIQVESETRTYLVHVMSKGYFITGLAAAI